MPDDLQPVDVRWIEAASMTAPANRWHLATGAQVASVLNAPEAHDWASTPIVAGDTLHAAHTLQEAGPLPVLVFNPSNARQRRSVARLARQAIHDPRQFKASVTSLIGAFELQRRSGELRETLSRARANIDRALEQLEGM